MQKIYLLLRKNVQTGPFTIDELFQQNLSSGDLIWVEGKSTSWCKPSDFDLIFHTEEKKETVATITEPDDKMPDKMRVGNIVPEKDLEKRAEEIRRRALASVQEPGFHHKTPVASYTPKTIYRDENKIHFTYHKTKKGFESSHIAAGFMVALIIGLGWYNGWSPINENRGGANAVAIPGLQEMKTTTAETNKAADNIELSTEQASAAMVSLPADTVTIKPAAKMVKAKTKSSQPEVVPENKATELAVTEPKTIPSEVNNNTTTLQQPAEEKAPPIVVAATKKEEATVVEDAEKKKKFGQVIAGIFKKKKKDDAKTTEDTTVKSEDN